MALTLEAIKGRVSDLDSHEQISHVKYGEVFGDRGERFLKASADLFRLATEKRKGTDEGNDNFVPDTVEITEKTVWENKGVTAPSHADMDRRPAVMDMMGIQRQLVFPTMGLFALSQALGGLHNISSEEERVVAWEAVDAYNEWAAGLTAKYPDRLWIATLLKSAKPGITVEDLIAETGRLIKLGAKAMFIPSGLPPAGLSPSDPALDPFYALMAEANVSLVTHPPGGVGFYSKPWEKPRMISGLRKHMAEENFVASLVSGGVFERHPTLRFAAIECGSSWLGPLAEFLDFWADESRAPRTAGSQFNYAYSLKPSEYIARNVRVTPWNFEPVEIYFDRYPHLQDCYCYSSDFPHVEGQQYSLQKFYENISPLGDKIVEKFFCTNGALVLP
ncbi:amidohydrolase family protein [Sphingobium sp. CFD-2]|uniref:amidohydrolase family protein n=1 Tax=Sphingobium sp. CFD-2 TaxID=2878542 RepID=UPI00214C32A8|nr:amidohydrolase [Sphingobium sp. CFD-2]